MEAKGDEASGTKPAAVAFVNLGLVNFEKSRNSWLQRTTRSRKADAAVTAKALDIEDIIERIFSPGGTGELAEPVPLGQMIDILIDVWESDGLYD
jgi:hypothetical protein